MRDQDVCKSLLKDVSRAEGLGVKNRGKRQLPRERAGHFFLDKQEGQRLKRPAKIKYLCGVE